ncbi:MAG: sulfurtransferase TusA family protein [Actinomycetes bacterium]
MTALGAGGTGRRFQLNTLGQVCPFPLVEAKQAIAQLDVGDELVIDFDCTQATDSIPHWAAAAGYPVTHFEQVGDAAWTITVQKS